MTLAENDRKLGATLVAVPTRSQSQGELFMPARRTPIILNGGQAVDPLRMPDFGPVPVAKPMRRELHELASEIIGFVMRRFTRGGGKLGGAGLDQLRLEIGILTKGYVTAVTQAILALRPELADPFWFPELSAFETVAVDETPDIPKQAPKLYRKDRKEGETPVAFTARVYRDYIGKGLTRSDIRNLDRDLYDNLSVWLSRHPEDVEKLKMPSQRQNSAKKTEALVARAVAAGIVSDDPIEQAKTFNRLASNIRYKAGQQAG